MRTSQRLQSDLLLLLTALIWGSTFVVQRVAAQNSGTFLFNGLRFWLGALVLVPAVWYAARQPVDASAKISPARNLAWVLLAGTVLFAGSALQQAGLKYTSAANAGFITGLYVVFIPLILTLVLRHKVSWLSWAAALTAALGAFLLSAGRGGLLSFQPAPGDGLELIGSAFWGVHVILVGSAVKRMDVLRFSMGQILWCGALNIIAGLALEGQYWGALLQDWWAVAYAGLISVGIAYTLQAAGQRHAPPTDASLILSLEAVFAAVFGYLFINESLSLIQVLGCALILGAVVVSNFVSLTPGAAK